MMSAYAKIRRLSHEQGRTLILTPPCTNAHRRVVTDGKAPFDKLLADAAARRQRELHASARRSGEQDVEDVVQDALLRVVQASRTSDIEKPEHYLMRVVRRVAIDRRRARSRQPAMVRNLDVLQDETGDPERGVIGVQRLARALAAVEAMPARRREAFFLHRVSGLSYAQIARRQGVHVKTIEKHISLALAELLALDDE